MKGYRTKIYQEEQRVLHIEKKFDTGHLFHIHTSFLSENFIDFQKELIADFAGKMTDFLSEEVQVSDEEIKNYFEGELQFLNTSLQAFANKVSPEQKLSIKGVVWIIINGYLMASLIGDVSIMIVRSGKIYYNMHNDAISDGKIDVFSDFVEGELDIHDNVLSIGVNYKSILDTKEIQEINEVLQTTDMDVIEFIERIFSSKIDIHHLCYIVLLDYNAATDNLLAVQNRINQRNENTHLKSLQRNVIKNKYAIAVSVLGIVVVIFAYAIIKDMFSQQENIPQIETAEGTKIVTIASIQRDIDYFQKLDVSSNLKGQKYQEIMEQLAFLESIGRRPDDVIKLKSIVQNKYYEGFNVIFIDDLQTNFDTPSLYTFTSTEKETLTNPVGIYYMDSFMIAGTKGVVLGGISNDIRGTQIAYNRENEIVGCSQDLSRQGLYCFDNGNNITHITRGSIQNVTISPIEGSDLLQSFETPIRGLDIFSRNSFYVLHGDSQLNNEGKYITRYVNVLGQFNQFQPGTKYPIVGDGSTGLNFQFSSFGIDATFIARSASNKGLYQMRRPNLATNDLAVRKIILEGGDTVEDEYSDNIKVIVSETSNYVYLFDKENQTFTVYRSSPLKTNERFRSSYNLIYLFRFKFDLGENQIVDATVPANEGTKPYLYLLTRNGVHQVSLGDFIDQFLVD